MRRVTIITLPVLVGAAFLAAARSLPIIGPQAAGATATQDSPCAALPSAAGLCAVTSLRGYRIDVPAEWQRAPLDPGSATDLAFDAPGYEAVVTVTVMSAGADPGTVLQPLIDWLQTDETVAAIRVGNGGYAVDLAVPNADAAAGAGAAYTDDAGVDWVVLYLVATKGGATYLVIVDATGGYLLEHAAQIEGMLASFQVAP